MHTSNHSDLLSGSSGTVRFTDLTSGVYTLKVILRSGSGEREVLKSKVVIPVKDEL